MMTYGFCGFWLWLLWWTKLWFGTSVFPFWWLWVCVYLYTYVCCMYNVGCVWICNYMNLIKRKSCFRTKEQNPTETIWKNNNYEWNFDYDRHFPFYFEKATASPRKRCKGVWFDSWMKLSIVRDSHVRTIPCVMKKKWKKNHYFLLYLSIYISSSRGVLFVWTGGSFRSHAWGQPPGAGPTIYRVRRTWKKKELWECDVFADLKKMWFKVKLKDDIWSVSVRKKKRMTMIMSNENWASFFCELLRYPYIQIQHFISWNMFCGGKVLK